MNSKKLSRDSASKNESASVSAADDGASVLAADDGAWSISAEALCAQQTLAISSSRAAQKCSR